ncbi:hypothetical protein AHAS_Ahas13G0131600 [Arachis hypogaea]
MCKQLSTPCVGVRFFAGHPSYYEECPVIHLCKHFLIDIENLVNMLMIVNWHHALREANSVLDILAKKGQHLPAGLHLFDHPPLDIMQALT